MRTKRAVRAKTLVMARQRDDKNIALRFEKTEGPAALGEGRETVAVLSPRELAYAVGAIRAANIPDTDDWKALLRTIDMLRAMGGGEQ